MTTPLAKIPAVLDDLVDGDLAVRTDGSYADPAWITSLAADKITGTKLSLGDTIGSAMAGSLLFAGTSGVLAQDTANLYWDASTHQLRAGSAFAGAYTADSNFAAFAHWSQRASDTNYALLADSNGATYLNAASGQTISLRIGNATIGTLSNAGLTMPTVYGGSAASDNLTLQSTSHATKGYVYLGSTNALVDGGGNVFAQRFYSTIFGDPNSGNAVLAISGAAPSQTLTIGNAGMPTILIPSSDVSITGDISSLSGHGVYASNAGNTGNISLRFAASVPQLFSTTSLDFYTSSVLSANLHGYIFALGDASLSATPWVEFRSLGGVADIGVSGAANSGLNGTAGGDLWMGPATGKSVRFGDTSVGTPWGSLNASGLTIGTVFGGSSASDNLTLKSTSHATLGNVYLNGTGFVVDSTGCPSSPGGSNSERYGAGSTATGANSTAIGKSASTGSVNQAIAFGAGASVSADYGIAVGYSASAGNFGVALGRTSTANTLSVAFGYNANAHTNSIAIGAGVATTASNQCVIGDWTNGAWVSDFYLGGGVTSGNSGFTDVTIHVTGGSGTDVAGGSLSLAAGKGTGAGAGGSIHLKVAPAGSSGSTLNALADALVIDSTKKATFSGPIGVNGSAPPAKAANPGTATGTDAAVVNALVAIVQAVGFCL
jgi:hypothetical protein